MKTNIGQIDRLARIIVGLALIVLALGLVPGYQSVWGWVGVIPLATGLIGRCPMYSLLGFNGCAARA